MRAFAIAGLLLGLAFAPLSGQATHLLVVTGLSGEPGYAATFKAASERLLDAAHASWKLADSSVWLLTESGPTQAVAMRGRSSRDGVAAAMSALAQRAAPGDAVLIVLIGHGSGEGPTSRVDLPGPDLTALEYAKLLDRFAKQRVVFVVAASASGDFLPVLAAPQRVIITATKASSERNESLFAEQFAIGLGNGEADADKDGRITALEAFSFARTTVRAAYEGKQRLLTEHAQLDDDGDGKGSADPAAATTGDGAFARQVSFGPPRGSSDPRVAALAAERQRIENDVAALRGRKSSTDSLSYERELERLLLLLAEKTRELRALERSGPP
ncbi:MAG: C13 family peptidase [Gemmatimonadales bacterium]